MVNVILWYISGCVISFMLIRKLNSFEEHEHNKLSLIEGIGWSLFSWTMVFFGIIVFVKEDLHSTEFYEKMDKWFKNID